MSRHHLSINRWQLQKAKNQRLAIAAANDEPCFRCHKPIDYSLTGMDRWGPTGEHDPPIGTILDQGLSPFDLRLLFPAHRFCNLSAGNRGVPVRSRAW